MVNLALGWQEAEFNIFGDCCGSQAVFNSGSTIVVRTSLDDGTVDGCDAVQGITGKIVVHAQRVGSALA